MRDVKPGIFSAIDDREDAHSEGAKSRLIRRWTLTAHGISEAQKLAAAKRRKGAA